MKHICFQALTESVQEVESKRSHFEIERKREGENKPSDVPAEIVDANADS